MLDVAYMIVFVLRSVHSIAEISYPTEERALAVALLQMIQLKELVLRFEVDRSTQIARAFDLGY